MSSNDTVRILSSANTGDGVYINSSNAGDISIYTGGPGSDFNLQSPYGNITLSCQNTSSGVMTLNSEDYYLNIGGNYNTNISGTSDFNSSGNYNLNVTGTGNYLKLKSNSGYVNIEGSTFTTLGLTDNYIKLDSSDEVLIESDSLNGKLTVNNGTSSGYGTQFNGRVSYNSFYQKSVEVSRFISIDGSDTSCLLFESRNGTSSASAATVLDAINGNFANSSFYGSSIIPPSNGRIKSISMHSMRPIAQQDIHLVIYTILELHLHQIGHM